MFRIRRVHDDVLPVNQAAIREVRAIFQEQFPGVSADTVETLGDRLRNPFRNRFRTILYVAEDERTLGFAIVMHDPVAKFSFLDYLASAQDVAGRGVGAALYEYLRDEVVHLGARAFFFECPPEDPGFGYPEAHLERNASRLAFYERYGARPIVGTAYQTPMEVETALPLLMCDTLDRGDALSSRYVRDVVRAILERKYDGLCPQEYVERVVRSIHDPVTLRPPRYESFPERRRAVAAPPERIALTVNDRHQIHHIRERGYVESPVRIRAILGELTAGGLFDTLPVREYPLECVTAVHDPALVEYLQAACEGTPPGKSIYPYVFPIRNAGRPPKDLSVRAGYFCIDTFTPINRNAFPAAKGAVDCTLTAADELLGGRRIAYSLVRPPGHHAERRLFGGFCYFNNAAVAAQRLSRFGRVAMLDVDYHHGNGQQEIFYTRSDVLTISLHGDPDFAYPYFTGFADEQGEGAGFGFNLNFPLPEALDGPGYRVALRQALDRIVALGPTFLVVSLGLDTAKGDPTGTWDLRARDFEENGRMIGRLGLPTLVVQEGGYRTRTLGVNARHFFRGLSVGAQTA